jgi:hypothetical protein
MTNIFDGSDEPLSYQQAFVMMAQQISWPTEAIQTQVVRAIQAEKGLLPPEPDHIRNYADPRDVTLRQQDDELAALRKQLDNLNAAAALREEIAVAKAKESWEAEKPLTATPVQDGSAGDSGAGTTGTEA